MRASHALGPPQPPWREVTQTASGATIGPIRTGPDRASTTLIGSPRRLPRWITPLLTALLFGSVVLRVALLHAGSPRGLSALGLLVGWLALLIVEPALSRRRPWFFAVYLALQSATLLLLIASPALVRADYSAVLFALLSLQVMQRLSPRLGVGLMGLFTLLTAVGLLRHFGTAEAIGHILIYAAANALLGAYALATRRAQEAGDRHRRLALDLDDANRRLRQAAAEREQLAIARARHELARELHDSVTQTVFSMTLTTESALLLLEREPSRLVAQLDHLDDLAKAALAQMQQLISELRPEVTAAGGLEAALRRHLTERHLPEGLSIHLESEGDGPLTPAEEYGLFAIAREAVNNIVKHAHASSASIRLHRTEPYWLEVCDNGRGVRRGPGPQGQGVGLEGMREQAAEIGWDLVLSSSPGQGTSLMVTRPEQARSPA